VIQVKSSQQEYEEYEKARRYACRLLTFRDRTEQEMANKLADKGISPEAVAEVMEYLIEYDFINDYNFTTRYIEKNRAYSIAKIRGKLGILGVKPSIINKAIEDLGQDFEYYRALIIISKKVARNNLSKPEIISFLRNRGFNQNTIEKTCNHLENSR
jgi:regulatory protein